MLVVSQRRPPPLGRLIGSARRRSGLVLAWVGMLTIQVVGCSGFVTDSSAPSTYGAPVNAIGRMTRAQNGTLTSEFRYDERGRLTHEDTVFAAHPEVRYHSETRYDAIDRPTRV